MIEWNIYEITTKQSLIHGVMLRGRIRKFSLENNIELLVENATDKINCVRFALCDVVNFDLVAGFVENIITDSTISIVLSNIKNPVLSKLKVNKEDRYSI